MDALQIQKGDFSGDNNNKRAPEGKQRKKERKRVNLNDVWLE